MTFNAASRLRSLEDRSAALGSRRCELPGMHSVPKSAVLPYASGVGGLSRRLLNIYIYICTGLESYLHLLEACWKYMIAISRVWDHIVLEILQAHDVGPYAVIWAAALVV